MDTQGLVLKAKVHSADIFDRDGIKLLIEQRAEGQFPRLSHLWLDAGYNGQEKGTDYWVEKALSWTAEIVRRPPKAAPEEVMKAWVTEWKKEGVTIDRQKLLPPKELRAFFLPKRWIVERTFS